MAAGKADIFLTYCTNAALAVREQPTLKRVALPASLPVGADYGLTTLKRAAPGANKFADYLLSDEAQKVFVRYGFSKAESSTPGISTSSTAVASASASNSTTAQTRALARLSIDFPSGEKRQFSLDELEKLPQKSVSIMIRDKGPFIFKRVPVFTILDAAGYDLIDPNAGRILRNMCC